MLASSKAIKYGVNPTAGELFPFAQAAAPAPVRINPAKIQAIISNLGPAAPAAPKPFSNPYGLEQIRARVAASAKA